MSVMAGTCLFIWKTTTLEPPTMTTLTIKLNLCYVVHFILENRNFSFDKYAQMHKDVHTMMGDLTADHYPRIDSRSIVKHLVDGISISTLDTAKATLWVSDTLRTDFEGTGDLFKTFITRKKTGSFGNNNSLAASTTQHGGGGCGGQLCQSCGRGGGGCCGHKSFVGRGCSGGSGYQGRGCCGSGQGKTPRRINGIDVSDRYYNPNEFEKMVNEGCAKSTSLRK